MLVSYRLFTHEMDSLSASQSIEDELRCKEDGQLNESYICRELGVDSSIFIGTETTISCTACYMTSASVPADSFVYATECNGRRANFEIFDEPFETIDLGEEDDPELSISRRQNHEQPRSEIVQYTQQRLQEHRREPSLSASQQNLRKRNLVLTIAIIAITVVIVVIIATVLSTYWLH